MPPSALLEGGAQPQVGRDVGAAGTGSEATASPLRDILHSPVTSWPGRLVNDFERSVFPEHPEIPALKEEFYRRGALYAAMSGSGSAVFALFPANV